MSLAPETGLGAQSVRFPFPSFFTGWYRLCGAEAVRGDAPLSLHAFGRELVAFRDLAGNARVLDAFCAHLGAHLGDSTVADGIINCPFHGWRFDGAGHCVGAPGARQTPKAHVRSWPTVEVDGALLVWFSPTGEAPGFSPKSATAAAESRFWTRPRLGKARRVRTHVQELAENGVDTAHFAQTHAFHIASAETMEFEIAGPTLRHLIRQTFKIFGLNKVGVLRRLWPQASTGFLEFSYQGVGVVNVMAYTPGFLNVRFLTTLYFTPIDLDHCSVVASYRIRRHGLLTPLLYIISQRGAESAIKSDVSLLERKIYRPRPRLSDADGPILRFRDWASQFHRAPSVPTPLTVGAEV